MTIADGKRLEKLRVQEAATNRVKEFDSKQQEIDRMISRRSRAWHQERTNLAFARVMAGLDDRMQIRKDMIQRCPALATTHEIEQFRKQVEALIEEQFQACLRGLSATGVRPPPSALNDLPTLKARTKQRIQMACQWIQLENGGKEAPTRSTINVSGENARVNINSHDGSTNTAVLGDHAMQHLLLLAHPNVAVSVIVDNTNRTVTVKISNRGAYPIRLDEAEMKATDDEGNPFLRRLHELSGGVIVASHDDVRCREFLGSEKIELHSGAFADFVEVEFDCQDVAGLVKKRVSYTNLFGLREIA